MTTNTSNQSNCLSSSPCPTIDFRVGGDGASHGVSASGVLAHCRVEGSRDLYYYSTTFSGGPGEKCPPDIKTGGSLDEVTVRPAPILSNFSSRSSSQCTTPSPTNSFSTSSGSSQFSHRNPESSSQYHGIIAPRPIPLKSNTAPQFDPLLTPPSSTPSSASSYISREDLTTAKKSTPPSTPIKVINGFTIAVRAPDVLETPPSTPEANASWLSRQTSPALKFLLEHFPESALSALPYATSVSISQGGVTWEGVVLALPGQPKTLYVGGQSAETVQLRESIVALLDLADEHLECSSFVIALERSSSALGPLLHSLMYVSGTVVTKPPFPVNPKYVLVGMEI